jgi:signal transduction histidine kinase
MDENPRDRKKLMAKWAGRGPILFVVFALATLVVAPWAVERYLRPLNAELRDLGERGRGFVSQIHVALALQASAFHEFVHGRRPELLQKYRDEVVHERAAYDSLAPITAGLGSETQERLAKVRELEQQWHSSVDVFVNRIERGQPTAVDPLQEESYDNLLIAAARLDEAINDAALERRRRIEDARAVQRNVSALLGILAIAGVVVAWGLGQRLQKYANEAEERRAQAEAVMQSKARLIRGVTHDLKNPLHAIDGHAQLLEDGLLGELTAAQRDSVGRMRRGVRTLLSLIDDLLELGHAETGQISLSLQRVKLADLVRDVVDDYRPAAEARGLHLDLSVGDELPEISTDPQRVGQVLGNLLSNAVKYTPSGGQVGVRVAADRRSSDGNGRAVTIEVADNGPGIPKDQLENVFQEFHRLHGSEAPGAGLGLAIGRRVARLLGGDIKAQSERGAGSRFTLSLPTDRRRS